MDNYKKGLALLLILGLTIGLVISVSFYASEKTNETTQNNAPEKLTISQFKMKEAYGWKEIILWTESKESFEKAYNTKLNWMNYAMGFQRDPTCISPIGGDGEWQYDKMCFNFVLRSDLPNMLDEIAAKTKGKTLVVIGSIHDNNQRFSGDLYWHE